MDEKLEDRQLSLFFIDKSSFLEEIINSICGGRWEDLLGEIQLAFLMFLLLYSHDALMYWKKIIDIVCRRYDGTF